jgi:hypothetical protein
VGWEGGADSKIEGPHQHIILLNINFLEGIFIAVCFFQTYLWCVVEGSAEARMEDFIAKWDTFCGKLGSQMNKDTEGAALKLLITTIHTRNDAGPN